MKNHLAFKEMMRQARESKRQAEAEEAIKNGLPVPKGESDSEDEKENKGQNEE